MKWCIFVSACFSIAGCQEPLTAELEGTNQLSGCNGFDQNVIADGDYLIETSADIARLADVKCITGKITTHENSTITSFAGLSSLEKIEGDLSINHAILSSLSGLDSLTSIGGKLYLAGNHELESLVGLGSLTSVGQDIHIFLNSGLVNLTGLENLTSVGGSITIDHNVELISLAGLEKIVAVERLGIHTNGSLRDLNGLSNLIRAKGLLIGFNPSLVALGLESLTSIEEDISIINNDSLPPCEADNFAIQVGRVCSSETPPTNCVNNNGNGDCT